MPQLAGRIWALGASFALMGVAPLAAQPISVPSDPRASYTALQVTPQPNGVVTILTRRAGPSGTSFALREVDCRSDRARYLGEGDTAEEAQHGRTPGTMAPLAAGSISWHVARFACATAGGR